MKYVYKQKNGTYFVQWAIPGANSLAYLGIAKNEEEAKELLNSAQFKFYTSHSYLLPKAVGVRRDTKTFTLSIVNPATKKTVSFGALYKTIEEVETARWKILEKLI